jgi:metallo-beta-lactamase superfamily protein
MADALSVRIRMYRKGFGDRFLLTFSEGARRVHMLIDCGTLKGTQDSQQIMQEVVSDIKQETGGTLDLLVVTHEHWDHISGFHQAREIWDRINVNEVWMAWTENPRNSDAEGLRSAREKTIADLKKITLLPQEQRPGLGLESLLLFANEELDENDRPTTRAAMIYAGDKANGNVRFLDAGSFTRLPGIEGARVYVLGPPRSKELFKDRPSAKNSEVFHADQSLTLTDSFFAAAARLGDPDSVDHDPRTLPFGEEYQITPGRAGERAFFQKHYFGDEASLNIAWRKIEHDWLGVANALALSLDSDTNNTSLVLAIELVASQQVLLFPGDAQVGNWLTWHSYTTWKAQADDEPAREITATELLKRTVFYKVAHHGSHNATLSKLGLDLMGEKGMVAMIPVDEKIAKQQGPKDEEGNHKGWAMPFPALLDALHTKTNGRVIRADAGMPIRPESISSDAEWKRFEKAVEQVNDVFIDYRIDD